MGDKWQEMAFGECADLVRDNCVPEDALGKSYIGLEHIEQGTLRLIGTGIAEDVTSTKSKFKTGDILFGKLRPYFRKVVRPKFDGICSTDIWVVRSKKGIDQGFLFYWMASKEFVDIANQGSEGTKMPRAKWDFVTKIRQKLPPLLEQKAIASTLGALDDKIELNRKINETLEAMARTIFKSWFVDFDPIPGIGPHKEWQDSLLGKIPKGWGVRTIGDILELAYGKALKADVRQPGKIPVYGSNGQVGWHNEKLVNGPGIVVGRKGNPGIVTWVATDYYPIDTTFYVVPKGIIKSVYYLFHALKLQDLPSLGADSAVPGLNRNMAYMNRMIVPPEDIVAFFDKQVKSLADTVNHNDEQSRTLASIRDTLLPKLLSGEIRVKDTEKFVEKTL